MKTDQPNTFCETKIAFICYIHTYLDRFKQLHKNTSNHRILHLLADYFYVTNKQRGCEIKLSYLNKIQIHLERLLKAGYSLPEALLLEKQNYVAE